MTHIPQDYRRHAGPGAASERAPRMLPLDRHDPGLGHGMSQPLSSVVVQLLAQIHGASADIIWESCREAAMVCNTVAMSEAKGTPLAQATPPCSTVARSPHPHHPVALTGAPHPRHLPHREDNHQ